MKIKYRISDGEILEVESHPTHLLIAREGEKVEEYKGERLYAGMVRLGKNEAENKKQEPAEYDNTEKLIQEKIREIAIDALAREGKIDINALKH